MDAAVSRCRSCGAGGWRRRQIISGDVEWARCYGRCLRIGPRCGGILRDMEFIQFTPTAFAAPEFIRGSTIVGTLLTLPGVAITNANGERFMRRYDPSHMKKTDRATLTRAMTKEILAERGSPHSGVFLDLRSVTPAEMDQHRPGFYRFCRQASLDPQTQLLEAAP